MTKILIVEDEKAYQETWARQLGKGVEILQATTVEKAEELFSSNPDVDLIIMDGCVDDGLRDTLELVRDIRSKGYAGPIIAASANSEFQEQQVQAGCDYQCIKESAAGFAKQMLGL